ncbi:MAG: YkvA family protein [Pseudomonadales bacterium]
MRFQRRAGRFVGDPPRLARLLVQAARKMALKGPQSLRGFRDELMLLLDLVRAWRAGEYRDVSTATLISVVAAILYFVVPLDVIPDFIVGWGFLDDVAVVSYVMGVVGAELDRFERWRNEAASAGDAENI